MKHVVLRYVSEDGEEGFPCKVIVSCTYVLEGDCLKVKYEGWMCDESDSRETVINLTNHSYFNLTGG